MAPAAADFGGVRDPVGRARVRDLDTALAEADSAHRPFVYPRLLGEVVH